MTPGEEAEMAKATVVRRATGMPTSDVTELLTQWNAGGSYWVLNAAIALSTATYSASAFMVLATNGTAKYFTAATGAGFTGITAATGNVVIVAAYITQAGTHIVAAGATAASFGVAALPTIPATAYAYGAILIKASNASAFTGGTTALDGTNASAVFVNLNGPAGFAFSTARISAVPG